MSKLKETDDFGNRMKGYESAECGRQLNVALPVYARLDGRAFSAFTRGMAKPFDPALTGAMVDTTKYLVHTTHAVIGYTQSDEISLLWLGSDESDIFFSGKVQKMCSVLASMCTAKFGSVIPTDWRVRLPHFDCRVCQLPSKVEASNMILWRAMDARKNAISMVAQSHFSPKALFGKDQKAMLAMIAEFGIVFDDYPACYRRGTFVQRRVVERLLTEEELARIPADRRPDSPVMRNEYSILDMPPFNEVKNRVEVIFEGENPIT